MSDTVAPGVLPWLLVEASREGVLRFATAAPSARPRISDIHEVLVAGVPTFTDALQRFEREKSIPLRGLQCAMAIAGAASGEAISLVRSRWTISRAGLHAVFGTDPVILNDVAARAWATRSGTANVDQLRGVGAPNFTRPGRYAMVMVEEGVGAAIIDVDRESGVRVLETEAGHMDFSPTNEREGRLASAIRETVSGAVSWEMVLMLDRNDPIWGRACPDVLEAERPRLQAALLSRFAINLMHSFGAWQGVMLTGTRAGRMLEAGQRVYFDSSFTARRNFGRLIGAAPAWRVDQHEAVLTGVAERLAYSLQPAIAAAA
ncbi:MAG: glucokinase [Xanthobacteraceae bacterium]